MTSPEERTATPYKTADGVVRVSCDAPGERAVSAPIPDVQAFIEAIAELAGIEVLFVD